MRSVIWLPPCLSWQVRSHAPRITRKIHRQRFSRLPLSADFNQRVSGGDAGRNDPARAPRKISRHRLKRNGTPDKADQQPADLKQPEYEGHDPGKICFRFKFGHSLYCRFLRRNLPTEAYRHRAAFNRRPYARSRRQKQNRAGLIQPARQRN